MAVGQDRICISNKSFARYLSCPPFVLVQYMPGHDYREQLCWYWQNPSLAKEDLIGNTTSPLAHFWAPPWLVIPDACKCVTLLLSAPGSTTTKRGLLVTRQPPPCHVGLRPCGSAQLLDLESPASSKCQPHPRPGLCSWSIRFSVHDHRLEGSSHQKGIGQAHNAWQSSRCD